MVTDGIVKIHVHISFHRGWTRILRWTRVCSHYKNWLPLGLPMWPCTCCFLPSTRPTGQLEGRGAEVTWRVSDWSTSVGCNWHCLHVLDPDRLSAARWVAVLFVRSLCEALAVFVSWTRANSKHWFTASFLQPLPYFVTSQVPENCQLTRSFSLLLKLVSLLQTTQIKQGASFIAASKVYTSANKTTIVWIETELFFFFFYPGWMRLVFTCVRAWALGCFYSHINTQTFRRALSDRVGGLLRGDKGWGKSSVTKSGRVWRKVPESVARSVGRRVCTRTDAAMTLQLYVTVVRCSQTGWIDWDDWRGWRNLSVVMTEEGLAWLVIPQPPLHCRPCCCFWCCCWWWWWWWRSQSCRWCCCCGRLCCQSCEWLLSASSAMTYVVSPL